MATPVSVKVEAASTPPEATAPSAALTKFAVISSSSKRSNAVTTNDLRAIIEVAAVLSDKITLIVNDGIKVRVLDSARIALLDAVLPRSAFTNFEADGVGCVVVDSKSLLAVLRRAKNKGVELKFENGQLMVTIGARTFKIRTLGNASEEEVPQPKVNHSVAAHVDAETLREAVLDARVIKADAATLVAENNVLTFKASNETKEVEVRLSDATGTAVSKYSLDYLAKALRAFDDSVVEVKFGNNAPLELSATFGGGYVSALFSRVGVCRSKSNSLRLKDGIRARRTSRSWRQFTA
jgi:DNA polymerase III sliding clamp (beta) subunit (PCNA family)